MDNQDQARRSTDDTGEYLAHRRRVVQDEEKENRRGTDLGMLTITKLILIVTVTLGASGVIQSGLMDNKIKDLKLEVLAKIPDRSQVVDLPTYRVEQREQDNRLSRIEAGADATRSQIQQLQNQVDLERRHATK
jgi:hypothetical protein